MGSEGATIDLITPTSPLLDLKGVGPKRAEAFDAAGLVTVTDLLFHLPVKYEDRRVESKIASIESAGSYLLRGHLSQLRQVRIRRRGLTLIRGVLDDGSGTLPTLWFNRPYLLNQVEEGTEYLFYGTVRETKTGKELLNASCEVPERAQLSGRILPIYGSLGSLKAGLLRGLITQVFDRVGCEQIKDPIPQTLLDRNGLPNLSASFTNLHQPGPDSDVDSLNQRTTEWHHRLSYGEFLDLQLELSLLRDLEQYRSKTHSYSLQGDTHRRLFDFLPFELTRAQDRAFNEIQQDLLNAKPMLRLLQGDVGSGKTIIAALALVAAIENGLQAAMMAPTEILAEQHYRTFRRLLGDRYRIELISRSVQNPSRIRKDLASGDIQLLVGTHALIQKQIEFKELGVAVIDEQHRFGVKQRRMLLEKGTRPDLLVMTATPIPRSLALTVYGDLALSVIDELPPGRLPITTRVVSSDRRSEVYDRLRKLLEAGAQAYVVVPLVQDSTNLQAESLASTIEMLEQRLEGFRIEAFHGGTEPTERDRIMKSFLDGEIHVLLATSVIEVGLDVANASVMVIENAERFGLAQLHQLRGRVGRGPRPSFCIALHGDLTSEAQQRLDVFSKTNDGFQIADADLAIRGPGDLMGTRQSGLPNFRIGDLLRDRDWLERARRDAWKMVEEGDIHSMPSGYLQKLRRRAKRHYDELGGG
jgi:ATP-dependent DNA helicase RecG